MSRPTEKQTEPQGRGRNTNLKILHCPFELSLFRPELLILKLQLMHSVHQGLLLLQQLRLLRVESANFEVLLLFDGSNLLLEPLTLGLKLSSEQVLVLKGQGINFRKVLLRPGTKPALDNTFMKTNYSLK
jgi:hypothetical protein